MRVDWNERFNLNDEEQRLIRLLRLARAIAAALVIGGIAVVGVTSGPINSDPELARGSEPAPAGFDHNLMTLESGVPG